MRLIDAISLLDNHTKTIRVRGKLIGYVTFEDVVNAPTVDAEPVRHAHWEQYSVYGDINFRCSACKKAKFHNGEMIQKYRYCYNCGARMDEEAET